MMKRYLLIVVGIVCVGRVTLAQTNTPTNTATPTATPTNTPTLAPPTTPGSTDMSAWKYGSFKLDPTGSGSDFDHVAITIPGLKMGDFIVVYPPATFTASVVSWSILTNNTLVVTVIGTDSAVGDFEYVWFSRTQENCGYAPNCQRAPTATPTPTATATPA